MKTREDFQAWIRDGMQVPGEPEPEGNAVNWPCTRFELMVWPVACPPDSYTGGEVHATCRGCGGRVVSYEVEAIVTLARATEWMQGHARDTARLSEADARGGFGAGRDWSQVIRAMTNGKAVPYEGEVQFASPGAPVSVLPLGSG